MNTKLATIALLASATTLAACAKKAPETLPPPPSQTVTPRPDFKWLAAIPAPMMPAPTIAAAATMRAESADTRPA